MADPFIGEIRMVSSNFAPRGWFFCMGQYLEINQHNVLFSVLFTTYGGDGIRNFRLPNLIGRAPIHYGNSTGPGLSRYFLGESGGFPYKTVGERHLPSHSHAVLAENSRASTLEPSEKVVPAQAYRNVGPAPSRTKPMYTDYDDAVATPLNPHAVELAGTSEVMLDNQQPFQTSSFIICYEGIYPPRS